MSAARVYARGYIRDTAEKLAAKTPATEHPLVRLRLMGGHGKINGKLMTGLVGKADLSAFAPPIFDQGNSGSCTAHSSSGAIATALAFAKMPLPFIPSPDEIYKATRAWARKQAIPTGDLPPLTDSGAELADVASALAQYGVCAMGPSQEGRQSDVGPANVNDEPNVMALSAAGKTLVTGEYIVDPTADNASDVCAAALESGLPIWLGTFVDQAFENLRPGQIAGAPNEADPKGGGHALYISTYTTTAIGRVWTVRNSWGAGWCDGGTGLVGDAWLSRCWALYPMAVSPKAVA